MKGLDAWITGNYGEDHPDNTDDRDEEESCGPNRRYHLKTADGPLAFVFCDHCTLTTTRFELADGELVKHNEPCRECGGSE